ncbi:Gamma-aminobutyric acid type B receptor subunit 2 [Schistosoma japonicum]|nr:Gamma-aminobutyric acid type B receptor subunit 2 [Schistosoma japonicum]
MCQRLGLAIFLLWITNKLFCSSSSDGCFGLFEKLKWNRTFSFNNKVLTFKLEVTDNPEHWIVNYLFEILARERLGYTKIEFVPTEDNNISSSLKKLQCSDPQCTKLPEIHLNLLLWLPLGEDVKFWVKPSSVTDHGPLGPIRPWKLLTQSCYINSHLRGNLNHTSPKYECSSTIDVVNQIYQTETVKNSDLLNNHSSLSGKSITILDFELNSTCLRYNSYSIPPPPLCSTDARSTSINGYQYCHTESYQAVKVTWSELRTAAPQIFQLASKMYMSRDELEGLVHSALLDSNIDRKSVYKQVACRWLRQNPTKWKSWTIDWDKKLNLTIAGLFSMYGKWVLYGLDRVAQEAMNFVNADSDYFRNSEYALSLDVRNLTCEPGVVLSDYFKVLENAVNTRLIGSIAALCSDSIEAVVELANVRKQIIVSPTVGSARFLEQQQYHYFFRTVPSMTLANFILLRLFLIWGWHRIVVFRKSDHFFEPLLFQAKGIEIIANIEMDEQQLTYKLAKDTLEELRQQNSRIFVVEYDARGTYLILCAAYHEGMHFSAGYVWFLNPWLSDQWWSGLIDRNTECSFNEMLNITSWTFTVGHQLLIGPMVHSFIPRTSEFMDSDSKSGNNSSGAPNRTSSFEQIRRKRYANVQSHNLEEPPVLSRIKHNPNPSDFGKSTFSAHSKHKLIKDPLHDYTVYTYDAVILLASAVVHLLRENPAAASALNHPDVSETLRTLVARTNFGYRFQTDNSTTGQSNEMDVPVAGINDDNFGVDAGFQLAGDYYGIRSQSPASASNLRFNDHNERIADYWLLKQRHLNTTVPIIMWSTKSYEEVHERDQQQSYEPFSHIISSSNMSNKYDWKTINAPFLYDEFQKRMTERWLDHVNWHTLGGPPSDGSINEENCTLSFLSNQLRMGCTGATVFVTVTVTVLVLLPLIIFAHFYYRRKLKEIENRTRKPFEELCAELADLDFVLCELINHCCKHQWQHRPSSMNQVLEFQPTVGTCIISESAMTGLAAVDSVGGCTGSFRTMRSASAAAVPISSCSPSPIPLSLPDANNDKYYVREKRLSEQTNLHDGSTFFNHTVFNRPNNYTSNQYVDNSTNPKLNSCESYQLSVFPSVTNESEERDMMLSKSDEPTFVPVFDTYTTSVPSTNVLFNFPTSPILSTTPSYHIHIPLERLCILESKNAQILQFLNSARSDIPDELSSLLCDNQLQLFLNADSSMNVEESNRSLMLTTKKKYSNKHYFTAPKNKSHMLDACSLPHNLVYMHNFNHLRRTRSLVHLTASCYNMQRLQNIVKYKHCISTDHINLIAAQVGTRSDDLILPHDLSTFSSDPFIPSRK